MARSIFLLLFLSIFTLITSGCGSGFEVNEEQAGLLSDSSSASGNTTAPTPTVAPTVTPTPMPNATPTPMPTSTPTPTPTPTVMPTPMPAIATFADFQAVIVKNCAGCHGGSSSPFTSISNFAVLKSESAWVNSGFVVPNKPYDSAVYFRLAKGDGKGPRNMPFAFTGFPDTMTLQEVNTVKSYIANMGAVPSPTPSPTPIPNATPTPSPKPEPVGNLTCDPQTRGAAENKTGRLTKFELENTVRTIFGTSVFLDSAVQSNLASFSSDSTDSLGKYYDNAAENALGFVGLGQAIADAVFANSTTLSLALPNCNPDTGIANCKMQLVDNLGTRAFRRPLTSEQKFRILNLVDEIGGTEGLKAGIASIVASPFFTRHVELGDEASSLCSKSVSYMDAGNNGSFWAANGQPIVNNHNGQLSSNGWYVYMHSASAINQTVNEVRVRLIVQGAINLSININDQGFQSGIPLSAGAHDLRFDMPDKPANSDLKLGLYVQLGSGAAVTMENSELSNNSLTNCDVLGERVQVSQYELASRISYRAAGVPPDNELMTAARNNMLKGDTDIRYHAERLINSQAGRNKVKELFIAWLARQNASAPADIFESQLGINGDQFAEDSQKEFERFIEYIVFDKKGSFKDLHTENVYFANTADLAKYHNVAQTNQPIVDSTGNFAGLILRPATLVTTYTDSSPISRGNFVRERILCDHLPDPDPALVNEQLNKVDDDPLKYTNRQIVEMKTEPATCMGCHSLINPIGYTLESIGPFGKVRDIQSVFDANGNVIKEHGIDTYVSNVNLDSGETVPVSDAKQLIEAVSTSRKAMMCMAKSLIEFNRNTKVIAEDNCLVNDVANSIGNGESVYQSIIKSIVNEDIFFKAAGEI